MQTNTPATLSTHQEGPFPLGNDHRLFIGGQWVDTDEHIEPMLLIGEGLKSCCCDFPNVG